MDPKSIEMSGEADTVVASAAEAVKQPILATPEVESGSALKEITPEDSNALKKGGDASDKESNPKGGGETSMDKEKEDERIEDWRKVIAWRSVCDEQRKERSYASEELDEAAAEARAFVELLSEELLKLNQAVEKTEKEESNVEVELQRTE